MAFTTSLTEDALVVALRAALAVEDPDYPDAVVHIDENGVPGVGVVVPDDELSEHLPFVILRGFGGSTTRSSGTRTLSLDVDVRAATNAQASALAWRVYEVLTSEPWLPVEGGGVSIDRCEPVEDPTRIPSDAVEADGRWYATYLLAVR